ncbi:MAG: hypothetical protein KDC90_17030, partial [Ignavibacteriae bacterium]|nr:hypothetical protein [Ignavibacteriota bacterium]
MEVTYIFRKQRIGRNFSIEFIFKDLKSRLDKSIKTKDLVCPQFSEGIFKRIVNILYVSLNKGKGINHVTGDVHYTVLLLPKERTVLSIMDCGFMSGRKGLAAFFLKTFWLDLPVRKVKYVTTISEYTKKEVIKYTAIDPSKIIVIPVAINDIYKPVYKEFNTD